MKFESWCLLSPLLLTGCAAALVPYSSDPYQMLANASTLLEQDRPTPAERLITQALNACAQKQEPICTAEAYRMYGRFFMSAALSGQWKAHYLQHGFRDASATYEGRYTKALEYFDKAYPIFLENRKYDGITNIKLNAGFIYVGSGDKEKGCANFDQSLAANIENERLNPQARVVLPGGVSSYLSYINSVKQELGCSAAKK
ncbi:tetratricopeptide (TPR) repeat protein [Pseudomonas sp. TE3786]